MKPTVSHFDQLPNSAMITVKSFGAVIAASETTVWRRARTESNFPKPVRLSSNCTRWNVGDIRQFIAGKSAQLAGGAAQ